MTRDINYRRSLLLVLSWFAVIGGLLLAATNFQRDINALAAVELFYALVGAVSLVVFRNSKNLTLWSLLILLPLFTIVMYAVQNPATSITTCVWILVVPMLSYVLLGSKWGLGLSLIFVSAGVWLYLGRFSTDERAAPVSLILDLNLIICAFSAVCFCHFYEVGRERTHRRLKYLAGNDPLTGLSNRLHLDLQFRLMKKTANRFGQPLSLAVIDLDKFKQVNDQYGHSGGDTVLVNFADLLKNSVRDNDVVSRSGGEEFVVVMLNASKADCGKRIDLLRQRFAAQPIYHGGSQLQVSFSAGVAELGDEGEDLDSLMKSADVRLYGAKAQGRNCVVIEDDARAIGTADFR